VPRIEVETVLRVPEGGIVVQTVVVAGEVKAITSIVMGGVVIQGVADARHTEAIRGIVVHVHTLDHMLALARQQDPSCTTSDRAVLDPRSLPFNPNAFSRRARTRHRMSL